MLLLFGRVRLCGRDSPLVPGYCTVASSAHLALPCLTQSTPQQAIHLNRIPTSYMFVHAFLAPGTRRHAIDIIHHQPIVHAAFGSCPAVTSVRYASRSNFGSSGSVITAEHNLLVHVPFLAYSNQMIRTSAARLFA